MALLPQPLSLPHSMNKSIGSYATHFIAAAAAEPCERALRLIVRGERYIGGGEKAVQNVQIQIMGEKQIEN